MGHWSFIANEEKLMSWIEQQCTNGNALALAYLLSGLEVIAKEKGMTSSIAERCGFEGDFEFSVFLLDKVIPESEEKWKANCLDQPYSTCLYQFYQDSLPTMILAFSPELELEWSSVITSAMKPFKSQK